MRKYNPIRYYKKFKGEYSEFVVFIKNGEFYQSYDADARIVAFVMNFCLSNNELKVSKYEFVNVLKKFHEAGLNVALAGSKNVREYYTDKQSVYKKVKSLSKGIGCYQR